MRPGEGGQGHAACTHSHGLTQLMHIRPACSVPCLCIRPAGATAPTAIWPGRHVRQGFHLSVAAAVAAVRPCLSPAAAPPARRTQPTHTQVCSRRACQLPALAALQVQVQEQIASVSDDAGLAHRHAAHRSGCPPPAPARFLSYVELLQRLALPLQQHVALQAPQRGVTRALSRLRRNRTQLLQHAAWHGATFVCVGQVRSGRGGRTDVGPASRLPPPPAAVCCLSRREPTYLLERPSLRGKVLHLCRECHARARSLHVHVARAHR